MDSVKKVKKYQKILTAWLEEQAIERNTSLGNVLEYQVIADTLRNHYQLVRLGWLGERFVHFMLFQLDIKPDGKVWIQQNNTEMLFIRELVEKGIDKSDFVIGFRPEYMRNLAMQASAA